MNSLLRLRVSYYFLLSLLSPLHSSHQGRRSILLCEGAGNEWLLLLGAAPGSAAELPKYFVSVSIECKKGPIFSVKDHLILDMTDCLLYDIIHEHKTGLQSPPTAMAPSSLVPSHCLPSCTILSSKTKYEASIH